MWPYSACCIGPNKKTMKAISLIIYLLIMIGWAYLDSDGKKVVDNYLASWIIKYMMAFALILWGWYRSNVPYRWQVLGVFIIFSASAWIVFDYSYVIFAGLPWDFIGTTAWSDRWFSSFPLQMGVKLLLLSCGVYITVKL